MFGAHTENARIYVSVSILKQIRKREFLKLDISFVIRKLFVLWDRVCSPTVHPVLKADPVHHIGRNPELSIGPFFVTRSNPTHQQTDPTHPNPLQVEKIGPN